MTSDQRLEICMVDQHSGKVNYYRTLVLALFALEKEPKIVMEKLKEILNEFGKMYIARSLHALAGIADLGKEDGEYDGIDALCYHMNIHDCRTAMSALERVISRFNTIE